jgi:hypothetical protein
MDGSYSGTRGTRRQGLALVKKLPGSSDSTGTCSRSINDADRLDGVGVVEGSSHSLSHSKIRKAVGGSRGRRDLSQEKESTEEGDEIEEPKDKWEEEGSGATREGGREGREGGRRGEGTFLPFFEENNRRRGRISVDSIANDAAYLALASLTAQRGGRGKMEVGGGWSRNSRGRPEEKRAAGEGRGGRETSAANANTKKQQKSQMCATFQSTDEWCSYVSRRWEYVSRRWEWCSYLQV